VFTIASFTQLSGLFKLANEMGLLKFFLFAVIIIGAFFGIKFIAQYKFNKKAEKNGIVLSDQNNLSYHVLFTKGNYFLTVELSKLDVFMDKPVRRQMVIDLLRSYITTMIEGCKDISITNMKEWTSDQWVMEMTKRFDSMLQGAANRARESGMPEIVINKFNQWMSPSIELLFSHINTIGTSTAYTSNVVKTSTLFLTVNLLNSIMLAEAERSIHTLNGDITGTVYLGKIVEEVVH
jgi:hypothetical protein